MLLMVDMFQLQKNREEGDFVRKIFLLEFKRGIGGTGFYISIILLVIAGLMNTGEVLEYINGIGLPEGEIRCFALFFQAIWSEALCYMIPVVTTLALSASYLEDMQSGMLKYILIRTKAKQYLWSKVANCALFGALTVFLALSILLVGFMVVYPFNIAEIGYLKSQTVQYYTDLFGRAVVLILNGSFYAMFGGMIAAFSNNKYMAYAAPFIFYYVVSTLFSAYLSDYPLLNPKEWLMMNTSSIFVVLVIVLILNIIAFLAYFVVIERRWRYE